MVKSTVVLISLALATLLGALVFAFTTTSEPTYQGRSLSYWLAPPRTARTETAVKAIGTNAIPFLIRWIKYEPPPWRKKYADLAMKYRYYNLYRVLYGEGGKAMEGFLILTTNATPSIPALVNIM